MGSAGKWCLIESDPGVFSELIRGFGVTGVQVEELYALDESVFETLKPIHALIFLFKINDDAAKSEGTLVQDSRLEEMFFAKQVIHNACATQAIVNLLLNSESESIKLGDTLSNFKSFTQSFDPQTAGLAMSNQEQLRQAHNSFSRHSVFEMDESVNLKEEEDSFHFVGYIPYKGRLYELDGLQEGPLDHGAVEGDNWLAKASEVLQKRIANYSSSEIRFNLMALITDRRMKYEEEIKSLESSGADADEVQIELARLRSLIDEENDKLRRHKLDNLRRRHNYLPLIVNLLKVLARQGKLMEFYETALKRTEQCKKNSKSSPQSA